MRGWICLLRISFAFVKCTYRTYSMLLNILPCALHTSLLSVQALQSRSCISYLCHHGSLVTWMIVSLTAVKFKPLVISMSGFAYFYAVNVFILIILYDFCLLPQCNRVRVRVRVILRLTVYRQIISSGRQTPWGSRPQIFFFNWPFTVIVLM
jgi:hypothetical protein